MSHQYGPSLSEIEAEWLVFDQETQSIRPVTPDELFDRREEVTTPDA